MWTDQLILDAAPDIAEAYVDVGFRALEKKRAFKSVVVDGYPMTVAVREIPEDDRITAKFCGVSRWQILTRVDIAKAERLGLGTDNLDTLLAKQEYGANALLHNWNGLKAPFAGMFWWLSLRPDLIGGPRFVTKDNFRISLMTLEDWRVTNA